MMKHPKIDLLGRKMTTWQKAFCAYIEQQTGYKPEPETVMLAMLLQKDFRNSDWNKSRLGKSEKVVTLDLSGIDSHQVIVVKDTSKAKAKLRATAAKLEEAEAQLEVIKTVADWSHLKRELGPFWEHRVSPEDFPVQTTFTGTATKRKGKI